MNKTKRCAYHSINLCNEQSSVKDRKGSGPRTIRTSVAIKAVRAGTQRNPSRKKKLLAL